MNNSQIETGCSIHLSCYRGDLATLRQLILLEELCFKDIFFREILQQTLRWFISATLDQKKSLIHLLTDLLLLKLAAHDLSSPFIVEENDTVDINKLFEQAFHYALLKKAFFFLRQREGDPREEGCFLRRRRKLHPSFSGRVPLSVDQLSGAFMRLPARFAKERLAFTSPPPIPLAYFERLLYKEEVIDPSSLRTIFPSKREIVAAFYALLTMVQEGNYTLTILSNEAWRAERV